MDQVKFYLRQAVKYRFWIAVSLANLLAMIAYFVGSDPIRVAAETQTKAVESAYKDVKQYSGGAIPNAQYKPIVDEKKAILSTDVNKTWEKLYAKQAPLLTWPDVVNDNFREWGRKYPETVDKAMVQRSINDYVVAYPEDVDSVYKIFRPFDPTDGKGVVLAPAKEALLRPAVFSEDKLPSLGKIWAAKERLWIQRTLLEVVAEVNAKAKDWDGAIIKQINLLEVGNNLAQDQRSIAKGEALEEAPDLFAPGEEPAAADATTGGGGPMGDMGTAMSAMYMGAGGGGGGAGGSSDKVFYIKPATETNQYKILPVQMSVLVDQMRVQDFLVALENSPMSIQVMDIEVLKPSQRVTKPEKGVDQNFSGYGGYAGGLGMGMMGMAGYGGGGMNMGGPGGRASMDMMAGGYGAGGMMGIGGMGGMGAAQTPKGKLADTTRKITREKLAETAKKNQRQIQDPYYNIVEVVIYGQARFYNPAPKEEAPPESVPAPADAPAADGKATTDDPAKSPVPVTDPTKDPTPTTEAVKAESPKADTPKADEPKAEGPKVDTPKTDDPKSDIPPADGTPVGTPKSTEPPKSRA